MAEMGFQIELESVDQFPDAAVDGRRNQRNA
jgi:hypothetical protein